MRNIDQFEKRLHNKVEEVQVENKEDRLGAILSVKLVMNNDWADIKPNIEQI